MRNKKSSNNKTKLFAETQNKLLYASKIIKAVGFNNLR